MKYTYNQDLVIYAFFAGLSGFFFAAAFFSILILEKTGFIISLFGLLFYLALVFSMYHRDLKEC